MPPGELEMDLKKNHENGDPTIMITQFLNPQQFSYVWFKDVVQSASIIQLVEEILQLHCSKKKQKSIYPVNQSVIVLYTAMRPPKLLRGVVKRCQDDEYLVWIFDYGFTLCCSSKDMWPLPELLTLRFWEIQDGSIAYIRPRNDHWSNSCVRVFDKLMEDAIHLNFEVVNQDEAKRNFGKLLFKTARQNKVFQDAAEFFVDRNDACPEPLSLPTSFCEAFTFDLAEINDPMIKPRPRVKKIIEFVSSCGNPFPTNIQRTANNLNSEGKPIYNNISFNIVKAMEKSERNLSRPSERVEMLDKVLSFHQQIQVPHSAQIMRDKALKYKETCLQSALDKHSLENNEKEKTIDDDKTSSDYEDDMDGVEFMKLAKRSSSPSTSSTSSEESFYSINRSTYDLFDDSLSSESTKESMPLPKSSEKPTSEPLKFPIDCQNATEKSKTAEASPTPSSCDMDGVEFRKLAKRSSSPSTSSTSSEESFYSINRSTYDLFDDSLSSESTKESMSLPKSSEKPTSEPLKFFIDCQNATEKSKTAEASPTPSSSVLLAETSLHNEIDKRDGKNSNILAAKNNGSSMGQNDFKNGTKNTDYDIRARSVLAHGQQLVDPVSCLGALPFSKEIRRNMCDLNIRAMLPTQLYSWPHLLNGGSLALVDGCGKGRSWSYLPVLCSSVLRLLQNSEHSRELKLGPLAILLVDSKIRANALASYCDTLMSSNSDSGLLKVLNTLAVPSHDCHLMLLNSCGILVTTPDSLLDLIDPELALIDPKKLEYLIIDDFDRLRQTTPQVFDKVLQKLKGMNTCPSMKLILVAQQWHGKEFGKLLKDIPKPLALFGDCLEAAVYGGLKIKFNLRNSTMKTELLLKFLAEQKPFKKRTLIYCKNEEELNNLQTILTNVLHECVDLSIDQDEQPHQRNVELLIHYSLPKTWSMFAKRFSVMADQIPNYFTTTPQDKKKPDLLTYLLLDQSNVREFFRLTEFLRSHGFKANGEPWKNRQLQSDDSIPYCPYLLSNGDCLKPCNKRHNFIQADMPTPGNPLQKEGVVIRCKLYRVYDPGHMAVWPLEYQNTGSSTWVNVPYPVQKLVAAVEMSMGTKRNVHSPCYLGDVCVIHHQGHFKRVKIVDIEPPGPVTVQMMDYGTELMHVSSNQLLQCSDQKIKTLPPLAMDIRLSGVSPRRGKWWTDTTKYVQEAFGNISEREQMQITVDFAMLNVVYVKKVALVEKCPTMRTSIYKLLLSKELRKRGICQIDLQRLHEMRGMLHEHKKKSNEDNKENIQQAARMEYRPKTTKTSPSPPKSELKASSGIRKETNPKPMSEPVTQVQNKQELSKHDGRKELPSTKVVNQAYTLEEKIALQSSPEPGNDQPSTSTTAFFKALTQEMCRPSKKLNTQLFLESILEGNKKINHKKPVAHGELKREDAPQGAAKPVKPVSESLQYSTTSKGAVRPRVKWFQTDSHIELTIEQQEPEYELLLCGQQLIYNVPKSSPPKSFVLYLLREVRLVSQKQYGYYLRVKLAKVGILTEWPTLVGNMDYDQNRFPWLTYDLERAEEPSPPAGLLMWQRCSRHQELNDDYQELNNDDDNQELNNDDDNQELNNDDYSSEKDTRDIQ